MKLSGRGGHDRHSLVPAVNLLSPWVFEAIAIRRLRKRFTVAAAVLVLATGAGWGIQYLRTGHAEQVLTIEQTETERLTAETEKLAPVRTYVATVGQQKVLVQNAMATEVRLSRVLTGLLDATPSGAHVETTGITLLPPAPVGGAQAAAVPQISPCPGPDPFNTRVVVGCITLSGTADSRATVGAFVVRLGSDALFVEPFISTTTTAEGNDVVFTGSVGLSKKALSGRYDDIEALLAKEAGQ